MDIALNLGLVAIGLAGLYFGAEWLVRGSAGIAVAAGLSTLIVGLTVVAFGTSAPELIVSLQANWEGKGDFALGNVIGSNICNLGLVLAVAAIMTPIRIQRQVIRRELPLLLIVTVVFIAMLLIDGQIGRLEGLFLSLAIVAYTVLSIWRAKYRPDEFAAMEDADELEEIEESAKKPMWINFGLAIVGLVTLGIGSTALVTGGEFLAIKIGVSQAVIALTLVAFGTSLPELATTVAACLKGEADLASGNAIGSCLFNLLCVVGFTAMTKPIVSTAISPVDLVMCLAYPAAIFALAIWKANISRKAGLGMLIVYLAYVAYLGMR